MVVQNIECQLSTVLMKRFLDGDNLPQEVLDDLEKHLRVCPTCQSVIDNEKVSLEEVLDGPANAPSGIAAMMSKLTGKHATPGGFAVAGPTEALLHASSKTYAPSAPGMAAFKNPKVLFLSGALAVVLIVMSTVLRNPENLLGPKAAAVYGQTSEDKPAPTTTEERTEEPKDETHVDPKSTEAHGEETTPPKPDAETVKHEEDLHAANTPPKDNHIKDTPSTTKDEHGNTFINDPRVPGKPTVDTNNLIVAGGSHSTSKPTPTTPKPSAAKKPTPQATRPKSNNPPRKRPATTTKKKPATSSGKSSGIKVYDPSGKPIG